MRSNSVLLTVLLVSMLPVSMFANIQRWSEVQANAWYTEEPWLVGSNFVPANAINQLEMWQADTFDPQEIDKELGWAEELGMNTMRVFLHDLLWQQDAPGFQHRIDVFLQIADKHHIRPMFVLFDSCWESTPKLGPQHPPIPGVHNSGWVQSPGEPALQDSSQYPRLKAYVEGVVGAFANDKRILAWDVWNEPAGSKEVIALLPQTFEWAREANPSQPLTSGIFQDNFTPGDKPTPVTAIQIAESDVISFHNYSWPENFEKEVTGLEQYHRPLLCSEYMARSMGSTFDTILPIAKTHRVAAINWGFVAGKSQTYLPWDSWDRPYMKTQPLVWFHDVLHADGTPYRKREAQILRQLTGKSLKTTTNQRHRASPGAIVEVRERVHNLGLLCSTPFRGDVSPSSRCVATSSSDAHGTASSRTLDKLEMTSGKLMRIRLGTQPAHWLSPEDRIVGQPKREPTFGQSAG